MFTEGAGRGGRPDDGRGWEGRKKRREARADGSGASAGAGGERAWVGGGGVGGERAGVGRGGVGAARSGASALGSGASAPRSGAGAAVRRGQGRESGDLGEKRRDEAGRGRILG